MFVPTIMQLSGNGLVSYYLITIGITETKNSSKLTDAWWSTIWSFPWQLLLLSIGSAEEPCSYFLPEPCVSPMLSGPPCLRLTSKRTSRTTRMPMVSWQWFSLLLCVWHWCQWFAILVHHGDLAIQSQSQGYQHYATCQSNRVGLQRVCKSNCHGCHLVEILHRLLLCQFLWVHHRFTSSFPKHPATLWMRLPGVWRRPDTTIHILATPKEKLSALNMLKKYELVADKINMTERYNQLP